MSTRRVYPRSSAQPIYLTAGVLGLLGLAGVIVMLVAMADVPRQSYYLLIGALGLLIVAFAGALAVLLATNTRRPWGIDPNIGPYSAIQQVRAGEPFAALGEEPVRHAIQLPDGLGYGRRQSDDRSLVRRLGAASEPAERPQPPKLERPAWAAEMLPPAYRDEPREERLPEDEPPPSKPPLEYAEPSLTKIPLDQLDLPPIFSNHTESQERQAGASG